MTTATRHGRSAAREATSTSNWRETMEKNQVKGRANEAKGKVKEVTGKVIGNERMEHEGKAEKTAGKVQSKVGDVTRDVKRSVK
jgi:uncharacterized protein YjbJ (UPF0337 family)